MNTPLRLFLIAALTSAAGPAFAATPDDPCAIPLATVSSAMGAPFTRTRPHPEISSCGYKTARALPSVQVTTYRENSVADASAKLKSLATGLGTVTHSSDPVAQVTGVGDEAEAVQGFLYARKGTSIYVFSIIDTGSAPAKLSREEKLAKAVFATSKP